MTSLLRRMAVKRVIDTAAVVASAPFLIPLGLGTALAVRMKLGSPILFKQVRTGLNEEPFTLLKFRSMLPSTDENGQERSSSERLTKFGRLLRKSSLDELPQLWNVLRGDMSLIGPRPLLPEYLPHYYPNERVRHDLRPGLTGLAQIRGRNSMGWDSRLASDVEYVEQYTLKDDLRLFVETIAKVLQRKGTVSDPSVFGEYLSVHRSYPRTNDIALRRLEVADAELRVSWLKDTRTSVKMNVPVDLTVKKTASWILTSRSDPERRDLVAYEVDTGIPVSMLGIRQMDGVSAPEIHLFVDPDRHAQGVGTKSMSLLVQYLGTFSPNTGCWLTVDPTNTGAIRLYRNMGFKRSGTTDDRDIMELEC